MFSEFFVVAVVLLFIWLSLCFDYDWALGVQVSEWNERVFRCISCGSSDGTEHIDYTESVSVRVYRYQQYLAATTRPREMVESNEGFIRCCCDFFCCRCRCRRFVHLFMSFVVCVIHTYCINTNTQPPSVSISLLPLQLLSMWLRCYLLCVFVQQKPRRPVVVSNKYAAYN